MAIQQLEYSCLIIDKSQKLGSGHVVVPMFNGLVARTAITRVRGILIALGRPKPRRYIYKRLPQADGGIVDLTDSGLRVVLMAHTRPEWKASGEQIWQRDVDDRVFTKDEKENRRLLQGWADIISMDWRGDSRAARANRKRIQLKVVEVTANEQRSKGSG